MRGKSSFLAFTSQSSVFRFSFFIQGNCFSSYHIAGCHDAPQGNLCGDAKEETMESQNDAKPILEENGIVYLNEFFDYSDDCIIHCIYKVKQEFSLYMILIFWYSMTTLFFEVHI